MKPETFEEMLVQAELHPQRIGNHWGVAWSISLHYPTTFGTRIQVDWLIHQPAEFALMTREQATSKIAACKAILERAARTQQGVLCEPTEKLKKQIVQKIAPAQGGVKYPAH